MNNKLSRLLEWCAEQGIEIHQSLKILINDVDDLSGFGWSIGHTCPSAISCGTAVVRIPRHAVLSTRSCALSSVVSHVPYGPKAHLSLALALYSEMLMEDRSFWFGYIQSLPEKLVDLPYFWRMQSPYHVMSSDVVDRREATDWMKGTELERQLLLLDNGVCVLENIKAYYEEVTEPILARYLPARSSEIPISLDGFIRSFCLVSSRAFVVDAYHGLSMVPIADIFNHASENHVHLESDYDVCFICGSVQECPHDDDDDDKVSEDRPSSDQFVIDTYYEMIANAVIQPYCEVFNTYGEHLSNAELLARYGFASDVNDNDYVGWDPNELVIDLSSGITVLPPSMDAILHRWSTLLHADAPWVDSLTINSTMFYQTPANLLRLRIDSEGRISIGLWTLLTLISFEQGQMSFLDILSLRNTIQSLANIYQRLEALQDKDQPDINGVGDEHLSIITRTVVLIIELCQSRKMKLLRGHNQDPGERLDTITDGMPRTKAVLELVLSELAILSSCHCSWTEFQESLL